MKRLTMTHNLLTQKCSAMLSRLLLLLFIVVPQVAQADTALTSTLSGVKTSNVSVQADDVTLPQYDESVTFTAISGIEGYSGESYDKLFDGNTNTKWCVSMSKGTVDVVFQASKAGSLVGYTITTADDNAMNRGRNPKSWKIYGSMTQDGEWTLLETIENDTKLQDVNFTSYTFITPNASTDRFEYFKWEISSNQGDMSMQVSELKLHLVTCTHLNADGSSALGDPTSVEATCKEYAHELRHCSICNRDVKTYTGTTYALHLLTKTDAKEATCTEPGNVECWTCSVCDKIFSDEQATNVLTAEEVTIAAKGHKMQNGMCTVCGEVDDRFEIITQKGVVIRVDDPATYIWKYDADNNRIVSNNKGVNRSESRIKLTLKANKDFYLGFDYGVLSDYNDMLTISVDGQPYQHLYNMVQGTQKSFGYVFGSGIEHAIELVYSKVETGEGCAFLKNVVATTDVAKKEVTTTLYAALDADDNCVLSYGQIKLPCYNMDGYPIVSSIYQNKVLKLSESFKTYTPTSLRRVFGYFDPIEIKGLEYLNTAQMTDFSGLFANCRSLTSLDLSSFNTEKATNMSDMFCECSSLTNLDLSSFNTENVTDMSEMFVGCRGLTSLDLSLFNTTNAERMSGMFRFCENLTSLDISSFNTEKATYLGSMFEYCSSLRSIDVSSFNTKNVTGMDRMFSQCRALTSLDLSLFNTEKVSELQHMFEGCSSLTSLDLSSFNTAKVRDVYYMFYYCGALSTIYVSDKFTMDRVKDSWYMFEGCTNLIGATRFDVSNTDATMANYKTGYFKTYYQVGDEKHELFGEELKVDDLVLKDGKDFKAAAPFTATNVTYNREVKSATTGRLRGTISRWGSICLPYAITAPANCQLYTLSGVQMDNTTNEGTIIMEEVDQLEAGTPAFYCVKDASVTSVSFNASDAAIVNTLVDNSENAVDGIYLKGTYTTQAIDEGYVLMNNSMWNAATIKAQNSGKTVNSKGLRAYLDIAPNASAPAAQKLNFDAKETTGIEGVISVMNDADAEIYDANGRRQGSLQRGLNIIRKANGKSVKVMVK